MFPFEDSVRRRKSFPQEWKAELFKGQGGKCMYCGRKPGIDLMDIDHKNPVAKGGSDLKRNLQLICRTCNTRKGPSTDRQFRAKFKAAGVPQTQTPPPKPIPQSAFDQVADKVKATKAKKSRGARVARQNDPFGIFS